MLNRSSWVKRVKSALVGAVVIFGLCCGQAQAGDWPLGKWPIVLPTEIYGNIPGGQGMAFYFGTWEQTSRSLGGGAMTITENLLEFRETPQADNSRYRIIHEEPNYILVVTRDEKLLDWSRTKFGLFASQSHGQPVRKNTNLRKHYCGMGTWGTPEAFDWPVEKLIETFKKSLCLSWVRINETTNIGWGSERFQRADTVQ